MLAEGLKVLASRSMWLSPSFFCPLACQISVRSLNSNRAVVTKVKRGLYRKTFDTTMVLPDGATIRVRYPEPRQIIRLPIDVNNCSAIDMVRVRHLRTPRGRTDKDQEFISGVNFDPRKYLKKKN